jgi:polyhydroxyalkanoate synthesis regulator phasin
METKREQQQQRIANLVECCKQLESKNKNLESRVSALERQIRALAKSTGKYTGLGFWHENAYY